MKKILVLSDVHGDKRTLQSILKENPSDFKIFCGDLQAKDESLLKDFDFIVQGNCDYYKKQTIIITEIEGLKIMITHGHLFGSIFKKIDFEKLYLYAENHQVNLVLYGHNHQKADFQIKNIRFFNPGSTSFPRNEELGSFGIIEIENGKIISSKHQSIKD